MTSECASLLHGHDEPCAAEAGPEREPQLHGTSQPMDPRLPREVMSEEHAGRVAIARQLGEAHGRDSAKRRCPVEHDEPEDAAPEEQLGRPRGAPRVGEPDHHEAGTKRCPGSWCQRPSGVHPRHPPASRQHPGHDRVEQGGLPHGWWPRQLGEPTAGDPAAEGGVEWGDPGGPWGAPAFRRRAQETERVEAQRG